MPKLPCQPYSRISSLRRDFESKNLSRVEIGINSPEVSWRVQCGCVELMSGPHAAVRVGADSDCVPKANLIFALNVGDLHPFIPCELHLPSNLRASQSTSLKNTLIIYQIMTKMTADKKGLDNNQMPVLLNSFADLMAKTLTERFAGPMSEFICEVPSEAGPASSAYGFTLDVGIGWRDRRPFDGMATLLGACMWSNRASDLNVRKIFAVSIIKRIYGEITRQAAWTVSISIEPTSTEEEIKQAMDSLISYLENPKNAVRCTKADLAWF